MKYEIYIPEFEDKIVGEDERKFQNSLSLFFY